jgi:hypothetical protein
MTYNKGSANFATLRNARTVDSHLADRDGVYQKLRVPRRELDEGFSEIAQFDALTKWVSDTLKNVRGMAVK